MRRSSAGRTIWLLFRESVEHAARQHGVAIHAYVFMTIHVQLLATPGSATSVPKMVQAVGRVYVQYFNSTYRRTGTLRRRRRDPRESRV